MIRRIYNRIISDQASRRRIRFYQMKSALCPICNNVIYYDTKEKMFRCKKEDCTYRKEKVESLEDDESYNLE